MFVIQSIVFQKSDWKLSECKTWLKSHKFKQEVDNKKTQYRFRQIKPRKDKNYITKTIFSYGKPILLVMMNIED